MQLITLTSDLGTKDHYLAKLKGKLLSLYPNVHIIDITHQIEPFNISEASYVFQNSYQSFPKGTVHLLLVNIFEESKNHFIITKHHDQIIIAPDNGLIPLVTDSIDNCIKLQMNLAHEGAIFPIENISEIIQKLLSNKSLDQLGEKTNNIVIRHPLLPVINNDFIKGNIIYIDVYGNAISNITKKKFIEAQNKRGYLISFKRSETISEISNNYSNVPEGEKLCLFNSSDMLEIAINKGNASNLFGLMTGDSIQIDFV